MEGPKPAFAPGGRGYTTAMRVLRRDPDPAPDTGDTVAADADGTPGPDSDVDPRPRRERLSSFLRRDHDRDDDGVDDRVERDERAPAERPTRTGFLRRDHDRDGDGVDDRAERSPRAGFLRRGHDRDDDGVDDRAEREPVTTTTVHRESEVVVDQWSFADAVVGVIGAGLALVGALVLVRTGIDASWYRPVETVADATHTPLLGAIEVGAGVLLMLTAAARSRALPALAGLAIAVAGALAAIEHTEVSRELAIEESWAWMLAGVGLLVSIVSLVPPRRRRVERLVES